MIPAAGSGSRGFETGAFEEPRALVRGVSESRGKTPDLDELDAGWGEDDEDDVDSAWGDAEDLDGPAPKGLTPEEREAREARVAARKERQRLKASAKAERRKARASAAASKQKKSAPRVAGAPSERRPAPRAPRRVDEPAREVEVRSPDRDGAASGVSADRIIKRRRDWRPVVVLVLLVVVAGAVALLLWRR
jgi:hypothetical protein